MLPNVSGGMPNLQSFYASSTGLAGHLPESWGELEDLEVVELGTNGAMYGGDANGFGGKSSPA